LGLLLCCFIPTLLGQLAKFVHFIPPKSHSPSPAFNHTLGRRFQPSYRQTGMGLQHDSNPHHPAKEIVSDLCRLPGEPIRITCLAHFDTFLRSAANGDPAAPLAISLASLAVSRTFSCVKRTTQILFPAAILCVLLLTACRSTYYAAYEKFGVYKRDLLKKRVVAARDEQKEAGEQFKDALTRLKELYGFDGGKLEKAYSDLKGEYDDCASRAESVRKRIKDVETVAGDLFAEWEKEIAQISTPSLQEGSRKQLRETRERYESLHTALKKAEESMAPVLTQFHDHILALKHSLNAQAIASLKGEATNIQTEISKLIAQMNAAIAKADEFVRAMQ
jgi:hypothetical protein